MSTSQEEVLLRPHSTEMEPGIDWDAYATQYDLMAKYNPSYHENIELLRGGLDRWGVPSDAEICDLGAGTGNYISALFRARPQATYTHVDFDSVMNDIARDKYKSLGLERVSIHEAYVQRAEFPDESFDLVICVNALYAMSPQEPILDKIRNWLKPGGVFFVIDFGRRFRMIDWGWYFISSMIRNHGVAECARFLLSCAEIYKQNSRGSKNQQDGAYWLHSTTEFGSALTEAGFEVEELQPCYRDYCDLAVCRKPISQPQP